MHGARLAGAGASCAAQPEQQLWYLRIFKTEALEDAASLQTPELEQIVREREDGYEVLYTAAE